MVEWTADKMVVKLVALVATRVHMTVEEMADLSVQTALLLADLSVAMLAVCLAEKMAAVTVA